MNKTTYNPQSPLPVVIFEENGVGRGIEPVSEYELLVGSVQADVEIMWEVKDTIIPRHLIAYNQGTSASTAEIFIGVVSPQGVEMFTVKLLLEIVDGAITATLPFFIVPQGYTLTFESDHTFVRGVTLYAQKTHINASQMAKS